MKKSALSLRVETADHNALSFCVFILFSTSSIIIIIIIISAPAGIGSSTVLKGSQKPRKPDSRQTKSTLLNIAILSYNFGFVALWLGCQPYLRQPVTFWRENHLISPNTAAFPFRHRLLSHIILKNTQLINVLFCFLNVGKVKREVSHAYLDFQDMSDIFVSRIAFRPTFLSGNVRFDALASNRWEHRHLISRGFS